jgi:hypothetical protein
MVSNFPVKMTVQYVEGLDGLDVVYERVIKLAFRLQWIFYITYKVHDYM